MIKIESYGKKATRNGYGDAMLELGRQNPNVVALCADLVGSLKIQSFIDEFPERFIQVGVAEANMMGIAAGLATAGKIPFTGTFANFSTGRVYDQIRQSIAYSHKNVKICASHAGISLGEDGATHQIMEDIGMMKMLPGMVVRPMFITEEHPFEIGKALPLSEGSDVSIFATGHLVWKAVEAVKQLEAEGISCELINIHTIKPLDEATILDSVSKTHCVVTAEEHQMLGGLGGSIAQLLARKMPTPIEFVAMNDKFGESGTTADLLAKYGLDTPNVIHAVKEVLKRK